MSKFWRPTLLDLATDNSILGSIWIFWSSAFLAALAGGWHCAGMCGPIAALVTNNKTRFLYQLGRLFSYSMLGLAAQSIGYKVIANFPKGTGIIVVLAIGLTAIWILLSSWQLPIPVSLQKNLWKIRPRKNPEIEAIFLGLLNGLLPCGWLYGFLLLASTQQHPSRAMVLMLALWLGSTPWLLGFSFLGKKLKLISGYNPWIPRLLLLALSIGLIAHALSSNINHTIH